MSMLRQQKFVLITLTEIDQVVTIPFYTKEAFHRTMAHWINSI